MKKRPIETIMEDILEQLKIQNSRPIMPVINPTQKFASTQGEWCSACGAWKSYGFADEHHCTGYKIT